MSYKSVAAILLSIPAFSHAQSINDSLKNNWSGSAATYFYFIPGEKIPPTVTAFADTKSLHLEMRYNYEDKNSLSFFAGRNFEKQYKKLDITITPIAGMVVGHTNGIIPGLELNASYTFLNLYSENEYMLDFTGKENYFFYSWTELNATIFENVKAGLLAQSLRWYNTKFDIQRGLYAEYSFNSFTINVYYFNPFSSAYFAMAALSIDF